MLTRNEAGWLGLVGDWTGSSWFLPPYLGDGPVELYGGIL